MSVESSPFVGEGFDSFPNLYQDRQRAADYSARDIKTGDYFYTNDMLDAIILEYTNFLRRDDCMPRAAATANEIIELTLFELAWRDGQFKDLTAWSEEFSKLEGGVCNE